MDNRQIYMYIDRCYGHIGHLELSKCDDGSFGSFVLYVLSTVSFRMPGRRSSAWRNFRTDSTPFLVHFYRSKDRQVDYSEVTLPKVSCKIFFSHPVTFLKKIYIYFRKYQKKNFLFLERSWIPTSVKKGKKGLGQWTDTLIILCSGIVEIFKKSCFGKFLRLWETGIQYNPYM